MQKFPAILLTLLALCWLIGSDLWACGRLTARRDARRSASACGLHVPAPPPAEQLTAPKQCVEDGACLVNEDTVTAAPCAGPTCSSTSACSAGGCAAGNTGAGMSRRRR